MNNHVHLESWCFASEVNQLVDIQTTTHSKTFDIKQFEYGTYSSFIWSDKHKMFFPCNNNEKNKICFSINCFSKPISFINNNIKTMDDACKVIKQSLVQAVQKELKIQKK